MLLLGEIADKMGTIPEMWITMAIIAVMFAVIACINRVVAWIMLILSIAVSGLLTYANINECWFDPISDAIWHELGWPWVISSLGSSLLPVIAVTGVFLTIQHCTQHK